MGYLVISRSFRKGLQCRKSIRRNFITLSFSPAIMTLQSLKAALKRAANPAKVTIYKNFHKTQKDDYAAGEDFLGITVPNLRKLAREHLNLSFDDILQLLNSNIHEEKYIASLILAEKYAVADQKTRESIFHFYIKNAKKISGWDLVDSTAPTIVGDFLLDKDISLLKKLAQSNNLWERRISIIAAYQFIKNHRYNETLTITQLLLNDKHDLIHKACGWMLREVGKRDKSALVAFLNRHYRCMPRTMLRYSIERFPKNERKAYLRGEI